MLNENIKYNIYICHPDDEIIFFGGILQLLKCKTNKIEITCFTCNSNKIRQKEFTTFMDKLTITNYEILDFKILRGINLVEIVKFYKKLCIDNPKFIISHNLYGEDHFHPQHIRLSIAVQVYRIINRLKRNKIHFISSGNNHSGDNVYKKISKTHNSTFKGYLLTSIKLTLFILHKLSVKSEHLIFDKENLGLLGERVYKSQNFDYDNIKHKSWTHVVYK